MLVDLVNGVLPTDIMRRLKRARLVAIPKPNGGVRPIAMGETLLKLAELVLLLRHESSLATLFQPLQQGVLSKSGCESVIHNLSDLYEQGHVILSLDFRNAFNVPSRDEIAKAVFGFATMKPFQRVFAAQYKEASELLFYGHTGTLYCVLESNAGVRQGSPLSTVFFCCFLQPMLETIAQEFPNVKVLAYVDDVSLTSPSGKEVEAAYHRLQTLLLTKGIQLNNEKCIWFEGKSDAPIPSTLKEEGVRTESEVIKVLGAFVGEEQRIGSELIRTLEKHHTIFRRLKKMGANNASLLLLSRSVNVRHRYHVRVHKPEASLELAQKFDHEIKNVVTSWLGPLSPEQEMIARLPLKKGGLGIPATEPLRNAAYTSSRHAVFEHQKTFSARMAQRMEPPAPAGTLEESHKTPEDEETR